MKDYYIFYLIIDGITEEVVKLRFIGTAGQNNWLHFQNVKTKENHLCNPSHFPLYTINGKERKLVFRYEESELGFPQKQARPEPKKKSKYFQHSRRWAWKILNTTRKNLQTRKRKFLFLGS